MTLKQLVVLGLIFFIYLQGAAQIDVIRSVENALKSSSSKELVKYLNQTIELNLDGEISTYTKTHAEYVLREFFKKNPSKGFEIIHNGNSKGGLRYAIGKYTCKRGYFRVWMRIKDFGGIPLVYEMNFIRE